MRRKGNSIHIKWYWAWLMQLGAMFALACLTCLSLALGKVIYALCLWGIMPLAGLVTSCCVTRAGLWNYAAWLVPPATLLLGNFLIWGYLPYPAPVFVCGFASLVGAAAGEVLKRRERNRRR